MVDFGKPAVSDSAQALTASNTGSAHQRASATRAALVLSQLLERADARAGDLAKAYDRARIAGQACERANDLVSGAQSARQIDH